MILLRYILSLCCFWYVLPASAAISQSTEHGTAELRAYDGDENITIELKIKPLSGWNIHSHRPGEFGMPTKAVWNLPAERLIGEDWSEGEDIIYHGLGLNVYKKEGFYRAILAKQDDENPNLDIFWMACNNECFPEKLHFDLVPTSFEADKPTLSLPHQNFNWLKLLLPVFLGGLILNLMPCVFPVLFIKIIAIIQSPNHRQSRVDAWAYLAGVMICFELTAWILQILKKHGQSLGWGFQLQSPIFVAIMAIVFLLLALMFIDVIRINLPLKFMPAGSFFTGFLSVLIASPCTAPFMGAAIGLILTTQVPYIAFYGVFGALGLGYALPFFMAGYFPTFLQKILPHPGKWMLWLKRCFAIPMLITCFWLLWILWGNGNNNLTGWQEYNRQQVAELTARGEKVLIDFGAKWCLTCLANEKALLNQPQFIKLAKAHQIHLFKADWTLQNPDITEALAAYGRSSVPLYVYYNGNGGYEIWPQILLFDSVNQLLQ